MINIYQKIKEHEVLIKSFPSDQYKVLKDFILGCFNFPEYAIMKDNILLKGYNFIF